MPRSGHSLACPVGTVRIMNKLQRNTIVLYYRFAAELLVWRKEVMSSATEMIYCYSAARRISEYELIVMQLALISHDCLS